MTSLYLCYATIKGAVSIVTIRADFQQGMESQFSVKIQKIFLAIKNFSVNDTMSGQPNKRLIHWHFEN